MNRLRSHVFVGPAFRRVFVLSACGLLAFAGGWSQAALLPDPTFTTAAQQEFGEIHWFHVLSGEKILAGGQKLFRLNADGTRDTSYPLISDPGGFLPKPSLEPDGGIMAHAIYYDPTEEGGIDSLRRYGADGTIDQTFHAVFGPYDQIYHLARDPLGRYLVGGRFPSRANAALIRLNHDGSFDVGFALGDFGISGLAVLPNGQILVAGATLKNGVFEASALVRLSSAGRVLQTTRPGTMGPPIVDRQGRILFSGQFGSVLGRLTRKGTTDRTFNPLFGDAPSDPRSDAIVPLRDGRILAGGYFGEYVTHSSEWPLMNEDYWEQSSLVRVLPDGTVDESLDVDGSGNEFYLIKAMAVLGNKLLVADVNGLRRFIETAEQPSLTFATEELSVSEGAAYVSVPIYRMGDVSTTAQASFSAIAESARSDEDFRLVSKRIIFKRGEWKKVVAVRLLDDANVEEIETFRVQLTNPQGGAKLGGRAILTISVLDDDGSDH